MAITGLKKWIDYSFSTGSETGEDYRKFERAYRTELKKIAEKAGFELYKFNKNHYEFSAVLRNKENNGFVYIAISDVRYFKNQWYNNILYRQMRNENDWTGLQNMYCSLDNLQHCLENFRWRW